MKSFPSPVLLDRSSDFLSPCKCLEKLFWICPVL